MGDRGIQHGDKTGGNEYQIRNQLKKLPLVPSFIKKLLGHLETSLVNISHPIFWIS